ncbi:MAG: hypothetical protein IPL32_19580 [Chloracidobacterium sp.]|jgi:hypothetical protein|nr:hypothetical protein [Chloracidobacterium sp.]
MVSRNELEREIELIIGMMADAGPEERDYLVGKLAALLWVAGQLRTDARRKAEQAWDQARPAPATR